LSIIIVFALPLLAALSLLALFALLTADSAVILVCIQIHAFRAAASATLFTTHNALPILARRAGMFGIWAANVSATTTVCEIRIRIRASVST
jgi:hypothetical protein